MELILASASPRRAELIKLLDRKFTIVPATGEEVLQEDIGPEFAPVFLAAGKALEVSEKLPDCLIIAADTVVIHDGEILGKPKDENDARRMLRSLSGNTHKVITGCCLRYGKKEYAFREETRVTFFDLKDEEIESYIQSGEPMDKAGAYGIQGKGALFVSSIEGDWANVVGLPIARLKRELDAFEEEIREEEK